MHSLIKIADNKNVFIVNDIYEFIDPKNIYIPILKSSSFNKNTYIYKNTYFNDFIASASGFISGSKKFFLYNQLIPCLKITNDFKENVHKNTRIKKVNNIDELKQVLLKYKLNNIYDKLSNNPDNIIVTCVDEEAYSAREFMCLSKNYDEILQTMDYLSKIIKINNLYLAIKSTNAKSIKNVKSIIGTYPNIKTVLLPDKYLISYKDNICEFLNVKANSIVLTTNEVYDIYQSVIKGKEIVEKLITISGDGIAKSYVIRVKLGTALKEVVDKFIEFNTDNYEVYVNGYLQGEKAQSIDELLITKDTDTFIINEKSTLKEEECINCGACFKICPFDINVKKCYFENRQSLKCIRCGLCNYICPAHLNLKKVVGGQNEK